ncbi:MAG TPA: hypothetical protein VLA56_16105 [Pseudomonadales bacterium]|nr:hypothetical protein [Pseudomonadales bacterium]
MTLVNGQTPAGTLVTNDAVLAYAVGTVPQDEIAASASGNAATFEVDRRLDVNVSRNGGLKSGTPGGVAELLFTVTNETNDTATDLFLQALRYDSDLAPVNSARVAATPLPGSTTRVCLDANANGQCEVGEVLGLVAGQGYLVPSAAAVPGTALDIVLEVSVPVSAVNGSWDSFLLSASVGDGTGLARIATDDRLLEDVATGENAVQNVFADADSSLNDAAGAGIVFGGVSLGTDSVSDGIHTDADQFQVATAVMSVVKLSEVIYDPINGLKYALVASGAGATVDTGSATGANPKAIPGAIVMYTISAQNDRDNVETAPSAATAQTVTITDTLPTELIAGNDAALTGLADCNVDGVGVLGTGTICTANLTDLATRLDVALVTQCGAATPAPIDILAENPLASVDLGSCTDADDSVGQEGTIVYYVTIP